MSNDSLPQMLDRLVDIFCVQMPFVRLFQLKVLEFTAEKLTVSFRKEAHLIGNFTQGMLHGGAAATVLDTMGGMQAIAAQFARLQNLEVSKQEAKVAHAATVNLNIHYLRPAHSDAFIAKARLVRAGRQLTVVDLNLYTEAGEHLVTGSGTFVVAGD